MRKKITILILGLIIGFVIGVCAGYLLGVHEMDLMLAEMMRKATTVVKPIPL